MSVASTQWIADVAFRLAATVRVADVVAAGAGAPDWYLDASRWADDGLLSAAALTGGPAMTAYSWAVGDTHNVVSRWTAWPAAGFGLLLVGEFIVTGDVVPALLYLAPLCFAVTALVRVHSLGTPPTVPQPNRTS